MAISPTLLVSLLAEQAGYRVGIAYAQQRRF